MLMGPFFCTKNDIRIEFVCCLPSYIGALMLIVMSKKNSKEIATLVTFFHNVKNKKILKRYQLVTPFIDKNCFYQSCHLSLLCIYKSRTYKNS